jgi:hypothetical protein
MPDLAAVHTARGAAKSAPLDDRCGMAVSRPPRDDKLECS